ncbi:DUF58 domain-containing protein [Nostoc sp. CHAB 5836]|nr:DUF58 domain-containing protein [Nostoc sp. CHAB 5836]
MASPAQARTARVTIPWAEQIGARLPPLLVEADRVAVTVMPGVHGRRRSGPGESFWQFRPYVAGDQASRVDWRQSAKTDRVFVRETEWEAAQTVALWCDAGPGMAWRSGPNLPAKSLRATLLLLALSSLLLRGGERVRLFGLPRPYAGRGALPALADGLGQMARDPVDPRLARHARAVLFSDFWAPLEETRRVIAMLAQQSVRGHMLQVTDPAEETLPYAGRIRFEEVAGTALAALVPRVESVRTIYAERVQRHRAGLRALAQAAGWSFAIHHTDQPPEAALLALHQVLAPA